MSQTGSVTEPFQLKQGAVGHVSGALRDGRPVVVKRMADPSRHDTEVLALRALAGIYPVPELLDVQPGAITMSWISGTRLDQMPVDERLERIRESGALLRRLHTIPAPAGLPGPPDDRAIVARYRALGGPEIGLRDVSSASTAFCHGDWTDANLLSEHGAIAGVVDWERAHRGDPMRELARAAFGSGLKDPRSRLALLEGYGASEADIEEWEPLHAAALWLWFTETGERHLRDGIEPHFYRFRSVGGEA